MPDRLLTPAAMATLLCLTTTAVAAQTSAEPPGTMNAERGWSSIARCAQEDTERARHQCLDGVLREAGLLTNEMRTKQQRRAFGLDDKAASAPATPTTTSASTAANASTTAPAEKPSIAGRLGETAPSPSPSSPPSRPAIEGSAPAAAATSAQPDRIEVELAKVEKAVSGKVLVTTTDGTVWLQTETGEMPLPPVAGDRMSIRKGTMGGYRCSVASTHLTYRCARSR
jgi:hypothetical protein